MYDERLFEGMSDEQIDQYKRATQQRTAGMYIVAPILHLFQRQL